MMQTAPGLGHARRDCPAPETAEPQPGHVKHVRSVVRHRPHPGAARSAGARGHAGIAAGRSCFAKPRDWHITATRLCIHWLTV